MLGLSWGWGHGGVMRLWKLSFGHGECSNDQNFGRIEKNELERLDIRWFLDVPRKWKFFENFSGSGFRRFRSRPGRAGSFWASRAGPAAFREIGPGRPFMDLLPKSSENLQKPRYFLPRTRNLLIFIEIHWNLLKILWFSSTLLNNVCY